MFFGDVDLFMYVCLLSFSGINFLLLYNMFLSIFDFILNELNEFLELLSFAFLFVEFCGSVNDVYVFVLCFLCLFMIFLGSYWFGLVLVNVKKLLLFILC